MAPEGDFFIFSFCNMFAMPMMYLEESRQPSAVSRQFSAKN